MITLNQLKHWSEHLFVAALLLFISASSEAVEIYTMVNQKCEIHQGLLLGVEEGTIDYLGLDGKFHRIGRDNINILVAHNTLENPIEWIYFSEALNAPLVAVYVDKQESPLFIGWAVKFIEDLVLFYDIQGNSHVLDMYKISRIRPLHKPLEGRRQLRSEKIQFKLGSILAQCPGLENPKISKNAILPTRTLGDKVQISEFLSNFQTGFTKLKSFQERTYVYALPYLYERESKLGISVYDTYLENPKAVFPFYFQWSTGREYRFQSFNQVGAVSNEYMPSVEPTFLLRSDVKSHIFNGSFVGNFEALSAGSSFYTDLIEDRLDRKKDDPNNIIQTGASLNYMALMGGDWGPWSFSIGSYYPVYYIYIQEKTTSTEELREILASKLTPIFRVMYTTANWKFRALFSQTNYKETEEVNDRQISIDTDNSVLGLLSEYRFDSQFFRLGMSYKFKPTLEAGIDQLLVDSSYREVTTANTVNTVEFRHLTTSLYIRHWFGEKVTLRGYLNYFIIDEDYSFSGLVDKEETRETVTGGTFEFVF